MKPTTNDPNNPAGAASCRDLLTGSRLEAAPAGMLTYIPVLESQILRTFAVFAGAALFAPSVLAGEIFFAEAQVIDAQPVYETHVSPQQVQQCGYEAPVISSQANSRPQGDARSLDPTADLVAALEADMRLHAPSDPVYRCHMATTTKSHVELTGYRVRYEYAGRTYERQMKADPGDTVRVRVRLSVGRPELVTQSD